MLNRKMFCFTITFLISNHLNISNAFFHINTLIAFQVDTQNINKLHKTVIINLSCYCFRQTSQRHSTYVTINTTCAKANNMHLLDVSTTLNYHFSPDSKKFFSISKKKFKKNFFGIPPPKKLHFASFHQKKNF